MGFNYKKKVWYRLVNKNIISIIILYNTIYLFILNNYLFSKYIPTCRLKVLRLLKNK